MTVKIPSSVKVGSRPRISWIRAYSSGAKPCSATICGVTFRSSSTAGVGAVCDTLTHGGGLPRQRGDQRTKNDETVGRAEDRLVGALRVRHQTQNISLAIANARDRVQRAVGIGARIAMAAGRAVTKHNLFIALEFVKRCFLAKIVAVRMSDRDSEYLALCGQRREWRGNIFHANVHVAADETQAAIAHESPGQQTGL